MNSPHKRNLLHSLVVLSIGAMCTHAAVADDTVDLGTVGAAGGAGKTLSVLVPEGSAAALAPSQSNLKIGEPQSVISRAYIENSIAPNGDYFAIVGIAPSVATMPAANGPGLTDGAKASMRGFQDGYYNITFDGIPFGDANDPTHHATAYFPAQMLGGVVIERGPGNASNLGQATFGGSINLLSRAPKAEQNTEVYGSFGSWNTKFEGIAFDSGRLSSLSDGTLQINVQNMESNGYLTNANVRGTNYMVKFQKPVGESNILTAVASFNDMFNNLPDQTGYSTLAQQALYGKNYLLNNDPTSQSFKGYNTVHKQTDFEYLRFQSDWGHGVETDNNLYTYAYDNMTFSGCDTTGPVAANPAYKTVTSTTTKPCAAKGDVVHMTAGDIPGYDKLNDYRVTGDIFKTTQQTSAGLAREGIWLEHAAATRHALTRDMTTGTNVTNLLAEMTAPGGVANVGKNFDEQSGWNMYQPFVEYEWAATPDLTITPGFKYVFMRRQVFSPIAASGKGGPQAYSETARGSLPFLTVTQLLGKNDSVYAQYAKGIHMPILGDYELSTVPKSGDAPEKTTNYQLGFVHKSDTLSADADVYLIDFSNSQTYDNVSTSPTYQTYVTTGAVIYKGVEGEATYAFGHGAAAFINGSINQAVYKANSPTWGQVINVPKTTAGTGLIYNQGPIKSSLIVKYIGQQYAGANQTFLLGGYVTSDFNLSYTVKAPLTYFKSITTELSVFNVTDRQSITSYAPAGATPSSQDVVSYQAPRSYMLTLKANF